MYYNQHDTLFYVANEIIDDVKRNGKKCIVFKANFEKVYDSVN